MSESSEAIPHSQPSRLHPASGPDRDPASRKILQFGTGKLLRGLFDPLVSQAASVTVVQSRAGASGASDIRGAADGYHLWVRGVQRGQVVQRVETVRSLGDGLSIVDQWPAFLALAKQLDFDVIVSNTTEKGLALDDEDQHWPAGFASPSAKPGPAASPWHHSTSAPRSFPARLVAWLFQRFCQQGPGITIVPLELIEDNAKLLQQLVLKQAAAWPVTSTEKFLTWLQYDCRWLSTLVDRICVDPVPPLPWSGTDPLAVMTEPFQMLAIADDGGPRDVLPQHPDVIWAKELRPYFLQKVRILNGLHTAMVARCLPLGYKHVIDVMNDTTQVAWLLRLLNEEIVPTLEHQGLEVRGFAEAVLDRFRNPFFLHRLQDIAVGHEMKIQVRLEPTCAEFTAAFEKSPPLLQQILALPRAALHRL